ncbi:MAG: histidinol-phosphatase HisJ family protein, partial [Clostridiales bacterium]|nr:histidinol-phosphatase HisJ family protein [Clostridiales bacterium]
MILRDYHTHTNFCDGKNTPEEMVEAAVEKGLDTIGFSGHGYTRIDGSYCMSEEETREYIKEINRLKEKYRGKINIRLGIERDYFSEEPARGYDYIIGSVHYVRFGDEYVPVDSSADIIRCAADRYCGGDIMVFCEKYYENVSHLCDDVVPDIIGHFDLVMKFNEKGELFDKNDPRYVAAWKKAADVLLKYDIPFEINTGAISRGYRTEPYPDKDIYEYLKDRGAKLILTGDTHKKENLCFEFEKFAHLANTFDIKRRICMIGHRGYSSAYPENTALAFVKAAENGSGGCETDVRITSDGEYVCCHNEDAVFCDGTSLVISESTYEQLTAKPLKNSKTGDDVRLCSFREYLEIMKKYGMVCFVELKG